MKNILKDVVPEDNHHLLEHLRLRKDLVRKDLSILVPWLQPCRVKVLLVTDGGLDFGMGDFGLSAFINCLQNDGRFYVKFDITLAHLRSDASNAELGSAIPGIVNRISGFRFDQPTHFTPSMYDQVWLFGIETNFHRTVYSHRNSNKAVYPFNRLSNQELINLSTFMRNGGGIFATGDHGSLGAALCGSVIRVRNMRYWSSQFVNGQDEVSMSGARRNDTNQIGDTGSQFSDQSDDIPQTIQPKYYYSFFYKYPHPLLCSKYGVIKVLPDHPHEGECIVPPDLTLTYPFDGSTEYPVAVSDGRSVPPDLIAQSHVISGNRASLFGGLKSPTQAHDFGAISAYDGHRAGVGRVVTDATWHHFVNVNLIGVVEGDGFDDLTDPASPKHDGFLSTVSGRASMAFIKEYYINIGVWISPPGKIACFNSKFWWKIIYSDRIMEAALADPEISLSRISINLRHSIGLHARDVLGKSAGQCQSLSFVVDWINLVFKEVVPWIDPWLPKPEPKIEVEPDLPELDPTPLVNIAFGTAIIALRQEFPYPPEKLDDKFFKKAEKITVDAAKSGLELAIKHYRAETRKFNELFDNCSKGLKEK